MRSLRFTELLSWESPFPLNWDLPITSLHCVGYEQTPLRFIRTHTNAIWVLPL